ncbi:MAG TPA: potassium transporter Kup [Dongiaceae bacterium]|nr:potassium transporter Kup [Dongiaceae bacterium]
MFDGLFGISTARPKSDRESASPDPPLDSMASETQEHGSLRKLSLAALGVVYGDIGTSPLYSIKEVFRPEHGLAPDHATVLGILSLIFWSLTLVVSIKYLIFVMRADNRGDGGIMALLSLVMVPGARWAPTLVSLGLIGTGLLLADGCITPAISVMGAVEGLEMASRAFTHLVVPITLVVLVFLFAVQRWGTAGIGAIFGPVMFVWFLVLMLIGAPWIVREPSVLQAVNPMHAVRFFGDHGFHGFLILGAVVLCITGAEALYADMGHFGKKPIRLAWFSLVGPALVVNYFGQGAAILSRGEVSHPFFALVSPEFVVPLVILSTLAAVIASQALISGSFSLAQQAVQLGYLPRLTIVHTSATMRGQIYVPQVNWMLMVACLGLVLAMRSTSGLAGAYGLSVMGTMAITTILLYRVARLYWGWARARALPFTLVFLSVDLSFLIAGTYKIKQGGWFPLLVGLGLFVVMTTWKRGRSLLFERLQASTYPIEKLLDELDREHVVRVPGTAVFLTSGSEGVPLVLLHHFKHNKVFHEKVVLLTVQTEMMPRVRGEGQLTVENLGHGFYRVVSRHGFMEQPSVPGILVACEHYGLKIHPLDASYYLGRVTLIPSGSAPMARWRKRIFVFLSRNARTATAYFGIPANRVVELGAQVEI